MADEPPLPAGQLRASYKDEIFVELCHKTRGGGDDHFRNALAKNYGLLGIYLSGIVAYIGSRELPTRLAMNEANPEEAYFAHLNPEDYAEHYDERHEDIELRMLMQAWHTSYSIVSAQGEDFSKLVLFNAGAFIGALADHDPPQYAFAFYFDPGPVRRIVFFGAGTEDDAQAISTAMNMPDADWGKYSKAYARWRREL